MSRALKDQALVLDLDLFVSDRSLKLLRGTHGDVLLWRGGVAIRALLPTPSQILQIRAQTGDRQEKIPATRRAVTLAFRVSDVASPELNDPWLAFHRRKSVTGRARLLRPEQ